MLKTTTKLKVRYGETDKMGIVYHSNYYIYFEVAREDFVENIGFTYRSMEENGVMMPMIETNCKYYEGAKYADELAIETTITELTPVKVIIEYLVTKTCDGHKVAHGKTVQAFVDSNTFKIVNLKKKHPDIWESFQKIYL